MQILLYNYNSYSKYAAFKNRDYCSHQVAVEYQWHDLDHARDVYMIYCRF